MRKKEEILEEYREECRDMDAPWLWYVKVGVRLVLEVLLDIRDK